MSKKLVLQEVSAGRYRLVVQDGTSGSSGLAQYIGREILCDGQGEDLIEKVFESLSGVYQTRTNRFLKKLSKKAETVVENLAT